jgi:hypothetical protein
LDELVQRFSIERTLFASNPHDYLDDWATNLPPARTPPEPDMTQIHTYVDAYGAEYEISDGVVDLDSFDHWIQLHARRAGMRFKD